MTDMDELRRQAWRDGPNRPVRDRPRLDDTAALVRKGAHPYELLLRGEETIAAGGRWTSPLETPWNPEHAFDPKNTTLKSAGARQPPDVAVSPPMGCGSVMAIHTPRRSPPGATPNGLDRGSPSPDKNRTVPGNGSSLRDAIGTIPKGC